MEELTTARMRLLKQGIHELPFSNEFKELMVKLGFTNLEQLSQHNIEALGQLKGFNTLLIHEYGIFMVRNNLGELVEP